MPQNAVAQKAGSMWQQQDRCTHNALTHAWVTGFCPRSACLRKKIKWNTSVVQNFLQTMHVFQTIPKPNKAHDLGHTQCYLSTIQNSLFLGYSELYVGLTLPKKHTHTRASRVSGFLKVMPLLTAVSSSGWVFLRSSPSLSGWQAAIGASVET